MSLPGSSSGSFWLFGSVDSPRNFRDGFSASESRIVVLLMGRALERGWRRSRDVVAVGRPPAHARGAGFHLSVSGVVQASPSVVTFIPTYFIL